MGQVNHGTAVLMSGLDLERLILAAGPVGLMQGAIDIAFPYVHERKQFDEPIGTFQVNTDLYNITNCSFHLQTVITRKDGRHVYTTMCQS